MNIENKLLKNHSVSCHELKDKIRTDPAMSSFIQKFLNLKAKKINPFDYKKVRVVYLNNTDSAVEFIRYMKNMENYTSIEFTEYITKQMGNVKRKMIYRGSKSVHSVVGKEYSNVLVPLDSSFYYDKSGKLSSDNGQYYPYDESRSIFEALTRVKENLLLVVINNEKLYKKIQEIITWKQDTENMRKNILNIERGYSTWEELSKNKTIVINDTTYILNSARQGKRNIIANYIEI